MKTLKHIAIGLTACCFLILILAAAPVSVAGQSKKDLKRAEKLIEDGNNLYRQKNYKGSIDKYAQAAILAPNNADAHFWKGSAHYNLNDYDSAFSELNKAEDLNYAKPVEIYKLRWNISYEKKNFDAAYEDIRKGLKIEPSNVTFLIASADIDRAKENYKDALEAYQKAARANPNDGDIFYSMALMESKLGNAEKQEENALAAIEKNTKYAGESYVLIAEADQKMRKFPEALAAYQKALAAKKESYEVYRGIGEVYRNLSRFNEAIDAARKNLRAYPADGNVYTDLSWYYSLANRHEEAIQAALAAIRFLPNQSLAYTNLCRAYNDTKRYALAITACGKALQLNPGDGETYFYLGRAYDLLGKTSEATDAYGKAVSGLTEFTRNNPEYSDGFYLLGNAYFADSQQDKAIDSYRKSLALSPRFTKARYNLGIIYALKGDKSSAMTQYAELLKLDKDLAGKLKTEIDKK